jgi:cell division protein FtsQ
LLAHHRKKKIRKNYYKNSPAKQMARRLQHALNTIKILFGLTAVAAMSFLFIFGYDLLTQSNYFKASQLTVLGNELLTDQDVLDQTGLSDGINIFSVNLTTTRKLLLAHPWIAEATVSRDIPSGISIHIQEQEPLAIIDIKRKFLLNTKGEIFKEWKPADPVNLPIISGLEFSDLNVGGTPYSQPFNAVMSVLKLGQKNGSVVTNKQIRTIEIDKDIGLTIHVNNSLGTIKLGYDDYPSKYKRLQEVLCYIENGKHFENVKSIDLNNPDRIVVNINMETSSAVDHKEV